MHDVLFLLGLVKIVRRQMLWAWGEVEAGPFDWECGGCFGGVKGVFDTQELGLKYST